MHYRLGPVAELLLLAAPFVQRGWDAAQKPGPRVGMAIAIGVPGGHLRMDAVGGRG